MKNDIIYGFIHQNWNHWTLMYINIPKKKFYYIDPFGHYKEEQENLFNKWRYFN